jgi:hypothetical protein
MTILGFVQVFSKDEGGMPRSWGPRANIPAANQKARLAAAQLLAQLAVLRLDSAQVLPSHCPKSAYLLECSISMPLIAIYSMFKV